MTPMTRAERRASNAARFGVPVMDFADLAPGDRLLDLGTVVEVANPRRVLTDTGWHDLNLNLTPYRHLKGPN